MVSKREWKRQLRDMTKCADCERVQKKPKKEGDECEAECGAYVVMWYGHLVWRSENWG